MNEWRVWGLWFVVVGVCGGGVRETKWGEKRGARKKKREQKGVCGGGVVL